MFFHVRDLEVRAGRFDVDLSPGAIEFLDPKLRQSGPLKAAGRVELVSDLMGEIRVNGHIAVEMAADCDRCLEPARFPIAADFELYYRPAEGISERTVRDALPKGNKQSRPARPPGAALGGTVEREKAIDPGEAEIGFYEGEGLELNDVLREYVLLAMPMQRLCQEGCKGICPACGQNRNQRECACPAAPVDGRWAALKEFHH